MRQRKIYKINHLQLAFLGFFTLLWGCAATDSSGRQTLPSPTTEKIHHAAHPIPPSPSEVPLSSIEPWFSDSASEDAATALREDRLLDAITAFDALAETLSDPERQLRARFLAAYLSFYAGNAPRAFAELPLLAESLPLMKDVIYEVTAQAAFRMRKFDECLEYAGKIEQQNERAAILIGDAYMELEQYDNALSQYRAALERWPVSAKAECQAKIVSCITRLTESYTLEKSSAAAPEMDSDTVPQQASPSTVQETDGLTPANPNSYLRMLIDEALTIIASMSAQSPSGTWTREACAHEDVLLQRIGREVSAEKKETRVAQTLFDDAHEDMLARRHEKALQGYVKAIKFAKRGGGLECRARYEKGLVTSFLRQHENAATLLEEVATDCDDAEISLKALYKAGKSYMSASRFEDAIRVFSLVEKQFSAHSYADDARLHGARCYLALGDETTFLHMIATLPDDYPAGDMRAEALWIGTKRALDANHLEEAKTLLEKYFHIFPIEKGWYTAGRSGYWYGRVQELLGDVEAAKNQYEYVITTTPFTFYMVLAYSRLISLDEMRAKVLQSSLTPDAKEEQSNIAKSLVEDGPFAEGVELIRLGLTTRGTKRIKSLLRNPSTLPSIHRAAAALFRHMGSFTDAREISSALDDGWESRYPNGEDYTPWTLAFPAAFEEDVAFAASESNVDPFLILAVMREESGFNPKIESWANAMGLMQLILPTARAMGNGLGIKVNRKDLSDPRTNIRLGAAFLSTLGDSFNKHPALMIPGYNAGGGAVSKWLNERGDMPLDLFVESIPYEQTRGYTKRVLASYATYRFLYEADHPFTTLDFVLQK